MTCKTQMTNSWPTSSGTAHFLLSLGYLAVKSAQTSSSPSARWPRNTIYTARLPADSESTCLEPRNKIFLTYGQSSLILVYFFFFFFFLRLTSPHRAASELAGVVLESEIVWAWPFVWKSDTKVFDLPISSRVVSLAVSGNVPRPSRKSKFWKHERHEEYC